MRIFIISSRLKIVSVLGMVFCNALMSAAEACKKHIWPSTRFRSFAVFQLKNKSMNNSIYETIKINYLVS